MFSPPSHVKGIVLAGRVAVLGAQSDSQDGELDMLYSAMGMIVVVFIRREITTIVPALRARYVFAIETD
ncbi:MAG: hypothetical protein AB1714_11875 [Acidobacteriota bacterium]